MSEKSNYCQLANAIISSSSTNNNTSQILVLTSSEFSHIDNESFISSFCAPSIVTDVCVGSQNGARNTSTTMKTKENESINDNQKYSFILSEKKTFFNNLISEDSNHIEKSQFNTINMLTNDEENLSSSINIQSIDNHHDIDTLSDTGTYILDDDDVEQKSHSLSSPFKQYGNQTKNRHGTFDIHGLISSTSHTIHRPIVDSNIQKHHLSLSSSNSSIHSFNQDENISENQLSLQQKQQIKPSESFTISPIIETKSFSTVNNLQRKIEAPFKSKPLTKSVSIRDSNLEYSITQSNTPPHSSRSNENIFHFSKQSQPVKTSIRPHTGTNEQTSSFQRQPSSLSIIDHDKQTPNLTKTYSNKSSLLRQQQSISKPLSRQPFKSLPSTPSITINSNNQTNRALQLRRARAQEKIEELTQRTKKQLPKSNQKYDIMSASWHSNPTNIDKKHSTNIRNTTKTIHQPNKQDLSTTQTISFSSHHRSSSVSPYTSIDQQDKQYQKMTTSYHNIHQDKCHLLRNNGQTLAIKLIQLSSGILEKLKPNNDIGVQQLEQLLDKLQMVNQTLISIDASLTDPTNDDAFI